VIRRLEKGRGLNYVKVLVWIMATGSRVLLTSDVGGTHGRVQLWQRGEDETCEIYSLDLRPNDFLSLQSLLLAALASARVALPTLGATLTPYRGVVAVCGPVWADGRKNESNNIPSWISAGSTMASCDAGDIECALGMPTGSLRFLNDFEAAGYAVAALLDPSAPAVAVPTTPLKLFSPVEFVAEKASPACVVGAGTGLGVCCVVPRQHSSESYFVLPSEAGMTSSICPQNEMEWRLLQWLRMRPESDAAYVEAETAISGPGISKIFEFLQSDSGVGRASDLSPAAFTALRTALPADHTAVIASLAAGSESAPAEPLCLAAIDLFLNLYGRFCQSMASTFLPYRGLYIAGGVLPKLQWRLDSGGANPLVSAFLAAGPHMTGTVARVPLLLLDDPNLGAKGCLYYATKIAGDLEQVGLVSTAV
jgi:glucokinase